jgi:hypothetical protein
MQRFTPHLRKYERVAKVPRLSPRFECAGLATNWRFRYRLSSTPEKLCSADFPRLKKAQQTTLANMRKKPAKIASAARSKTAARNLPRAITTPMSTPANSLAQNRAQKAR